MNSRHRQFLLLLLPFGVITTVLAGPNFTECKQKMLESGDKYHWKKAVVGLIGSQDNFNQAFLYTTEGCLKVCGPGYELYPWPKIAETVTTWVLPFLGLLLQAPYESNSSAWTNVMLTIRWLGSPIASLTCTLWNISVTGKCALLADMSTPSTRSDKFLQLTGSTSSTFSQIRDSFYLLSVLNQYTFTSTPNLEYLLRFSLFDPSPQTVILRTRLATSLRRQRRRGVVQVMITLFWFVVVLIISIHRAFGSLGENATAHDLALGLLLGWFPTLLATTVVDRNPMDSAHTRRKLNLFLETVQRNYPDRFSEKEIQTEVFGTFSGQGRQRWHYGAAHCILNNLEDRYLRAAGRDWHQLYTNGTIANDTHSTNLHWFDIREFNTAALSALLLITSCTGAFCISFFTPTVGLGCRSGGYMIFCLLTLFAMAVELASWPFIERMITACPKTINGFLIALEAVNTGWLMYIIVAQTFGIYNTCECRSSLWGHKGGYMDFESVEFYKQLGVEKSWMVGTVIGMLSIGGGIGYVTEQWLTQSWLWTAEYERALEGLEVTRRWKWVTMPFRYFGRFVIHLMRRAQVWNRDGSAEGRSVRWIA
ncbi:hypothetical protein BZA77DRAFT_53844 [Pyronema omphalodes]|nr:hypothetical protein BZA77DRAFT_53844 [Pyronema omphalodes]